MAKKRKTSPPGGSGSPRPRAAGLRERPTCPDCSRPLEDGLLYELRGSREGCAVVLRGVPCLVCPDEAHPKRFASPEFGSGLLDALFWRAGGPIARYRTFRRPACQRCERPLGKKAGTPGTVSGELRVEEARLTIDITGPVVECERCAARQIRLDRQTADAITDAIATAFERAGLEPQ